MFVRAIAVTVSICMTRLMAIYGNILHSELITNFVIFTFYG